MLPGSTLEICVDSFELAQAAARGGADRIELCGHLHDGGITPSAGLMRAVRKAVDIPVAMLVRPRSGTFEASPDEFETMRQEVLYARETGINVVVLGILRSDKTVDVERVRALVDLARPMEVTFHRAFDACADPERALEDVLSTGSDRILTSGACSSAVVGATDVNKLRIAANERIGLILCGGISPATIQKALLKSGVREVHASLRSSMHVKTRNGVDHPIPLENFVDRVRDLKRLMHRTLGLQ